MVKNQNIGDFKRFLVKELWEYEIYGSINIKDSELSDLWYKMIKIVWDAARDNTRWF